MSSEHSFHVGQYVLAQRLNCLSGNRGFFGVIRRITPGGGLYIAESEELVKSNHTALDGVNVYRCISSEHTPTADLYRYSKKNETFSRDGEHFSIRTAKVGEEFIEHCYY